jgi:trans-2,3-dihydro-3-hydroxyanthranilate isomerase
MPGGQPQYDRAMPRYDYLHLDVFTNTRFEGNQLAVFRDARGLDEAAMQRLAREMNFSESTFILPAERPDTDVRMRIFTPGVELPMAGHPTIGSTFALAHLGAIARGRDHFVYGLGVGPTRVELAWEHDALSFAWMDQRLPETRQPVVPTELIARAAGVDHQAFLKTGLPAEEITCGVPFIFLPLATRAAVDAAEPDMASLRALKSAFPSNHIGVFVFTTEATEAGVTAYSRMFGPGLGVPEDPATGSASGPLGCYLVSHGLVPLGDAAKKIVSWQGVKMGRPSRVHIAITSGANGDITRVQVGGQSVLVAEGSLMT